MQRPSANPLAIRWLEHRPCVTETVTKCVTGGVDNGVTWQESCNAKLYRNLVYWPRSVAGLLGPLRLYGATTSRRTIKEHLFGPQGVSTYGIRVRRGSPRSRWSWKRCGGGLSAFISFPENIQKFCGIRSVAWNTLRCYVTRSYFPSYDLHCLPGFVPFLFRTFMRAFMRTFMRTPELRKTVQVIGGK